VLVLILHVSDINTTLLRVYSRHNYAEHFNTTVLSSGWSLNRLLVFRALWLLRH